MTCRVNWFARGMSREDSAGRRRRVSIGVYRRSRMPGTRRRSGTSVAFVVNSSPLSPPNPRGESLSTPARHLDGALAHPDAHGLPREAGDRLGRLLGPHVGFPNRGLRLQPAATGGPGCAPSGTRLGTRTPVEDSNCNRYRSLEGSRLRTWSPVLLAGDQGLSRATATSGSTS